MSLQEGRHTPIYDLLNSVSTNEVIFLQLLAAATSNDSTQVVLRAENWQMDTTPTGTVNGATVEFTIANDASQAVVYADGMRVKGGGVDYTHVADSDTITFESGSQPYSTISVDYLPTIT